MTVEITGSELTIENVAKVARNNEEVTVTPRRSSTNQDLSKDARGENHRRGDYVWGQYRNR